MNIPITIHTTITKLWNNKHRDSGQRYQAAISVSRAESYSPPSSGFSSEPAKVVYINATGTQESGAILLSRRVNHVFADWRCTPLTSTQTATDREEGDDTPTIEFYDCDFDTEKHAIFMMSECEILSALRNSSRYDRETLAALQLLSQPNASLNDICKTIVRQGQTECFESKRAPLISCILAFFNSPASTYQKLTLPARFRNISFYNRKSNKETL